MSRPAATSASPVEPGSPLLTWLIGQFNNWTTWLNANAAAFTESNTFTLPQAFTGSATKAPVALVPQAAPSAAADGDVYADSSDHTIKQRQSGAWVTLDNNFRRTITLTTAEANAGKAVLLDADVPAGMAACDVTMSAVVGGATAWSATSSSTKLTLADTAGSPVPAVDATLAGLTGNVALLPSAPTALIIKAAAITGLTAGKGLSIRSDGTHDVVAGSTITLVVSGRFR